MKNTRYTLLPIAILHLHYIDYRIETRGGALTSEKDGYVRLASRDLKPLVKRKFAKSRTFSIAKEPKIVKIMDLFYSSSAKTVKIIDLYYSSGAKTVKIIDLWYSSGAKQ